jgi:nicotinamide mononucleotide adenylyltransferase
MHARNQGVQMMFLHVLSENKVMLKIARQAGATVVRDGSESEAHLSLEPATFNSHLTEMLEEQLAQANYKIKLQARQVQHWFARLEASWRHDD